MKKQQLFISALAISALFSCKKTTTNYYGSDQPSFIVNGITDVSLVNSGRNTLSLPLFVQYIDSSQKTVNLSLSPMPMGITMDTIWINSGTPSYSTTLTFSDVSITGAIPGVYPMTLTATSSSSKINYPFNIKVEAAVPCISYLLGSYSCSSACITNASYSDSVYADSSIVDKIWFTNINNAGHRIYAVNNCITGQFIIPLQTAGGVAYFGSGSGYSTHFMQIDINIQGSSCYLTYN